VRAVVVIVEVVLEELVIPPTGDAEDVLLEMFQSCQSQSDQLPVPFTVPL
jgi:hypothetical protein